MPDAPAENSRRPRPDPFALVIFGATGDLTHRKLIPAVYSLFRERLLPEKFSIIGFARRDKTDDVFRAEMRDAVAKFSDPPASDGEWPAFARRLFYHRSPFESLDGFRSLRQRLESAAREQGVAANNLFYLAAQPDSFEQIIDQLNASGLASPGAVSPPWSRIVVEKPFGRDLQSAKDLNARLLRGFSENQIFRIDHYLGKETVQNILVLRFANGIFEPVWNQRHVDHVQITVSETMGTEGRGRFYEQAGALRDMVQNHMMHLLCLVAMEAPGSLDANAVRDEKVKALRSLRPIPPECAASGVVRAQYTAGTAGGKPAPGYREEEGVAADSAVETYVAFKAFLDNWRWSGVPFYIRTGKRLPARVTEISIHFKPVPHVLFNLPPVGPMAPNVLALRIQPHEGISLRFQLKVPGQAMAVQPFQMDFGYSDAFGKGPPEAYERLLLDAVLGDPTLFNRADEVEAAWAFVDPIIQGCGGEAGRSLATYPAGTWGPAEAEDLIAADGRAWEVLRRPRTGR